jgi:hypothetical protein
MKQKILDQIDFAFKRYRESGTTDEAFKWGGDIQGLRFVLGILPGVMPVAGSNNSIIGKDSQIETKGESQNEKECKCTTTDLQPFGECQCSTIDLIQLP